jgi:hypothetical protein
MAKFNEAFPSNFLKAEDLPFGKDVVVTIDSVTLETLGQGQQAEQKFIVSFRNREKTLVLNKTNFKSIVAATGIDDTDGWGGRQIALFVMDVEYQGKMMPAIRVRPRAPQPAAATGSTRGTSTPPPAKPAPAREDNTGDTGTDEDVPF